MWKEFDIKYRQWFWICPVELSLAGWLAHCSFGGSDGPAVSRHWSQLGLYEWVKGGSSCVARGRKCTVAKQVLSLHTGKCPAGIPALCHRIFKVKVISTNWLWKATPKWNVGNEEQVAVSSNQQTSCGDIKPHSCRWDIIVRWDAGLLFAAVHPTPKHSAPLQTGALPHHLLGA